MQRSFATQSALAQNDDDKFSGAVFNALLLAGSANTTARQRIKFEVLNAPIHPVPSSRKTTLLLALLLIVGTLALYWSSLHNAFVNYDDPAYVTANAHVRQGLSWSNVRWAFTATVEANWHPLTWISHMADVQFFGLNPAGHHGVSVLLHAINVVLIFFLLNRAAGYALRSAVVAALFAVHPLNVESVAWVAERKSLLCTLFFLLALWAYAWYVRKPGVGRYLSVVLLFALGLMAKPMVITLPLVLLLLDYWPLRRQPGTSFLKLFAEKVPLFAMSIASALITIYAQHSGGALGITAALPLPYRISNAIYSYLAYIGKGIWPAHLAVFYPHPESTLGWWKVLLAVILLLAITGLVWRFRTKRYLLVGWLWYLGTMVPVIGIVQVGRQGMADRYAYIPFIGLFVMAVWLAAEFSSQIRLSFVTAVVITLAILSGYAAASYIQIGYWRDSITLFSHALQVTTGNGIAEDNLGAALMDVGRPDLALPHFGAAVRLVPQLATAHYNLATVLHRQNQLDAAMHEYQLAITYAADSTEAAQAHNNLGVLLMQRNQPEAAKTEFNAAIQSNPDEQNSYLGRGSLEYQEHHLDDALADFSRAAQIAPTPVAFFWLGRTLEDKGDLPAAVRAYEAALQMSPGLNDAQVRLDALQLKLRK
jgi:tetratricopeptide (TPR) repeat protein